MCSKAFKTLGLTVHTSKSFKLSSSLKTVHCSFVQSILEYASILWDPFKATYFLLLEWVQRRYFIISRLYFKNWTYSAQLSSLLQICLGLIHLQIDIWQLTCFSCLSLYLDILRTLCLLLSFQINFRLPARFTRSYYPLALIFITQIMVKIIQ